MFYCHFKFIYFLFLFSLVSCGKEAVVPAKSEPPVSVREDIDEEQEETIILYVAPDGIGKSDGSSEHDAAYFADKTFWTQVQNSLAQSEVEVKFLVGNYVRAYTHDPLVFKQMGNKDNRLILRGSEGVEFRLPQTGGVANYIMDFQGSQNITIDNMHFSGDGAIQYVMRFTRSGTVPTTNILVENCSWIGMSGVQYGASGCHYETTSHITYKNCTFKQIGSTTSAHMIYNAYGATHIHIINSHFEDCAGDYIRYRDQSDYGLVKGSTFIRNKKIANLDFIWLPAFIALPVFNDIDPGDEFFTNNIAVVDNKFVDNAVSKTDKVVSFHHSGFSPDGRKYLLTAAEGAVLKEGPDFDKRELLINNFGIDPSKVRIHGNTYPPNTTNVVILQTVANYGSVDLGFRGFGNITSLINTSSVPFSWEK